MKRRGRLRTGGPRAGTALLDAGAEPQQPITDVGGGRLIATATDPDGNAIGLLQDSEADQA